MNSDAVIGCDAVDAGPEWVRLKTTSGATRTIRWDAIKVAGMGPQLDGHVTINGVTEKVAPYRATHDSLWLTYAEGGLAEAMLEKDSPKRGAIVRAFEQHLGERWRGDELTESELMGPLMIPPKIQLPKAIVVTMAIVAIAFFAAIAILFFVHGAKPTSPP
jgi:hypothetical protein